MEFVPSHPSLFHANALTWLMNGNSYKPVIENLPPSGGSIIPAVRGRQRSLIVQVFVIHRPRSQVAVGLVPLSPVGDGKSADHKGVDGVARLGRVGSGTLGLCNYRKGRENISFTIGYVERLDAIVNKLINYFSKL